MVVKTGVSFGEYAWDRLIKAKPRKMNRSEWIETLVLRQLDSMAADRPVAVIEAQHAPTRISTPLTILPDGGCVLGLLNRSGEVEFRLLEEPMDSTLLNTTLEWQERFI